MIIEDVIWDIQIANIVLFKLISTKVLISWYYFIWHFNGII